MAKINIETIETIEAFQQFLNEHAELKHNDRYDGAFVEQHPEVFRPDTSLRTAYWTPTIRASWDAVKPTAKSGGAKMSEAREHKARLAELIKGMRNAEAKAEALALLELIVPEKQRATGSVEKFFGADYAANSVHELTEAELSDILALSKSVLYMNGKLKAEHLQVTLDMAAKQLKIVELAA